jgi:hypothetical protein
MAGAYGSAFSTAFDTTFEPSDIAGLKVWLKDTVSGSDNDPVSTWPGSDANTNDFVQATSGRKPTLQKAERNGLDAVLFDGSDDLLDGGDLQSEFGNSAASVFIAYAPTSDSHYTLLVNSDNDAWFMHEVGAFQGLFRTSTVSSFADSTPTNGWHVFTLVTGSDYRVWVDGVADAENPKTASWDNGSTFFYLGGRSFDDPQAQNRHMAGLVGEVLIYDTALSSTDRATVEAYLLARWGDQPASPAAVAGVGSVPAPTAVGATNALPAAVSGVGSVPQPSVSGGGAAITSPAAVAGVGSVPAPAAMGNATAAPAAVAGVGSVPAPTAKGNGTKLVSVVAGVGAVPAPTAFGAVSATALPSTVIAIGRVPHPTADGEGTGGGGGTSEGAADYWSIVLAS